MLIFEKIIVILINIISVLLGIWVWNNARKEKLNQWFGIMAFFMILWVDFAYLGYTATRLSKVVFWFRLDYGAVALFLFSAYSFFFLYFI